jgi:hypothetical protein
VEQHVELLANLADFLHRLEHPILIVDGPNQEEPMSEQIVEVGDHIGALSIAQQNNKDSQTYLNFTTTPRVQSPQM